MPWIIELTGIIAFGQGLVAAIASVRRVRNVPPTKSPLPRHSQNGRHRRRRSRWHRNRLRGARRSRSWRRCNGRPVSWISFRNRWTGYSDAQIGAAARDVHRDCGAVLARMFALRPAMAEEEGKEVEVPAGFDSGRWRLTGNVTGEPPFHGRLVHPGWEATICELPTWSGSAAAARDRGPGGSGDVKMSAQYVIGIDLGTTNSVLAFAPLDADQPRLELLPIPQLVSAATAESRSMLPSFLYLAAPHEAAGGALDLPWATGRDYAVGEFARRQAAEMPDRTVAAAKSWLCHSRVDRRQPILPWNAPADVPKVSPVAASQRYLEHLVAAWEAAHPDAPIAQQHVVLTVPASFDASARELTREAALAAGLPADLVLLEEPQAAVYAWLADAGDRWRRVLSTGETLLVCDVGGGTTDLTLVGAAEEQGELVLRRIAVGNHLLVGGDNMDLALAHHVAGRFAEKGVQLDPWQSVALWHSCRAAKETLLAPDGPKTHPISVLGRGRKVIGGTVSITVDRRRRERTAGRRFLSPLPADRPAATAAGVRFPRDRPAVRGRYGCYPALGGLLAGPRRQTGRADPPHARAL